MLAGGNATPEAEEESVNIIELDGNSVDVEVLVVESVEIVEREGTAAANDNKGRRAISEGMMQEASGRLKGR